MEIRILAILINGFGEGYGDTGDHFAVTDEGKVIYTTVQGRL